MKQFSAVVVFGLVLFLAGAAQANDTVRIAVLKFGTVNWELDTIKRLGLDNKHGFSLDVRGVAGKTAAAVMFQGGEADVIVSDWIWVARQNAAGKAFRFLAYSRQVGGAIVAADSGIKNLKDLDAKRIGIAGGPVDKSWLLVRAYGLKEYGIDVGKIAEPVFGAPPLLSKKMEQGELDAIITFWHFGAKLKAKGYKDLLTTGEAARALGLSDELPLLGYVFHQKWAEQNPKLVEAFGKASLEAKQKLAVDEALWDALRPRMKVKTDAAFAALKAGFRQGIPASRNVDTAAADRFFGVLRELGGEKLTGDATGVAPDLFWRPD